MQTEAAEGKGIGDAERSRTERPAPARHDQRLTPHHAPCDSMRLRRRSFRRSGVQASVQRRVSTGPPGSRSRERGGDPLRSALRDRAPSRASSAPVRAYTHHATPHTAPHAPRRLSLVSLRSRSPRVRARRLRARGLAGEYSINRVVCGGSESEGGTRRVVGVGMVVRHVDDGDCDAGEGGERREGAEAREEGG